MEGRSKETSCTCDAQVGGGKRHEGYVSSEITETSKRGPENPSATDGIFASRKGLSCHASQLYKFHLRCTPPRFARGRAPSCNMPGLERTAPAKESERDPEPCGIPKLEVSVAAAFPKVRPAQTEWARHERHDSPVLAPDMRSIKVNHQTYRLPCHPPD